MAVSKRHEASLESPVSYDEKGKDNNKRDDNRCNGHDDSDQISFSQCHCGALSCRKHLCQKIKYGIST